MRQAARLLITLFVLTLVTACGGDKTGNAGVDKVLKTLITQCSDAFYISIQLEDDLRAGTDANKKEGFSSLQGSLHTYNFSNLLVGTWKGGARRVSDDRIVNLNLVITEGETKIEIIDFGSGPTPTPDAGPQPQPDSGVQPDSGDPVGEILAVCRDEASNLLNGCQMTVGGSNACTTNGTGVDAGSCYISFLAPGIYSLTASRTDYVTSAPKSVTVVAGQITDAEISLVPLISADAGVTDSGVQPDAATPTTELVPLVDPFMNAGTQRNLSGQLKYKDGTGEHVISDNELVVTVISGNSVTVASGSLVMVASSSNNGITQIAWRWTRGTLSPYDDLSRTEDVLVIGAATPDAGVLDASPPLPDSGVPDAGPPPITLVQVPDKYMNAGTTEDLVGQLKYNNGTDVVIAGGELLVQVFNGTSVTIVANTAGINATLKAAQHENGLTRIIWWWTRGTLDPTDDLAGNFNVTVLNATPPPDAGLPDTSSPDAGAPDGTVVVTDGALPDSALPDSSQPDSALPDAGAPDAALPDSGVLDSGSPDSALPDSGVLDSGSPDSALPDSGVLDSGSPDSALPDSGVPDSGLPDSGTPDSGAITSGRMRVKCIDIDTKAPLVGCLTTETQLPSPNNGKSCTALAPFGMCEIVDLPFGENLRFLSTMTGYSLANWPASGFWVITSGAPFQVNTIGLKKL